MIHPEQLPGEIEQDPEKSYLSPREMEVLLLVSQCLTNGEIARKLGIHYQTVKNHVSSFLQKLKANDFSIFPCHERLHEQTEVDD